MKSNKYTVTQLRVGDVYLENRRLFSMASEQILNSPGILEREIDQSQPAPTGPIGVPAGVIGTANKGPAFVPVVVGNLGDFTNTFGGLDIYKPGTYAANEWLNNRTALTYLRVLGAGSDMEDGNGETLNAGVSVLPDALQPIPTRHTGMVQFLAQQGNVSSQETTGMPMFDDNDSFNVSKPINVVRGAIMLATGARIAVQHIASSSVNAFVGAGPNDIAAVSDSGGQFKLIVSSSNLNVSTDGNSGIAIYSASFNPDDQNYFGKVLNTDPRQFVSRQHLLYADFAVDAEILSSSYVAILAGSTNNTASGRNCLNAFGSFKSRYKTAKTPMFISQPFGTKEYDLFYFEAMDDGEYANTQTKITITNLQASLDPTNKFGSFTVQVRAFNDTDTNMNVLESYPGCTLDPQSDHYVGKLIGDRKVFFNFDVEDSEKRVVSSGKYANVSKYVKVQIAEEVDRAILPQTILPFGFRGVQLLKTNDALADHDTNVPRLAGILGTASAITGSILPPVPFRFKVTRGEVPSSQPAFVGQPGPTEVTNPNYCWGVKFERNDNPTNSNLSSEPNALISSYTKFLGIAQLDTLVTGSGADTFNDNKFTLAKVALSVTSTLALTSSVTDHMREAAYIRNATVNSTDYTIVDQNSSIKRLTFATLLQSGSAATFNQFSHYAKFSTFMYGGFDGVNFLDLDAVRMNDKISSFDALGGAEQNYVSPGLASNMGGVGQKNSTVASYKKAIDIMSDKMTVNVNVLAIPGIRDSFITDYAAQKVKEYGLAFYVMDIPSYDDNQNRLFDTINKPSVNKTANIFDARAIDNNYVGTYFPDVSIDDTVNKRRVRVPASVTALGAIGFNDRVAYPWFAPAGFNRAALDDVKSVVVRLNTADRDRLSNSRINPIATFPRAGFVIYGQKTLQVAKTSLNRVNVRRLLLEVKRIIIGIANGITFEQNTQATRDLFVKSANEQLGLIQVQSGLDDFNVIMDSTNNSAADAAANKLNGRIVLTPTKSVEYIGIDFIISNSGVEFV